MKIHNLIQGSPEWHAHRATHFNASDAPAMMGCSPYKTRSQLLHEMATGQAPEVDAATQRRFDDGHRYEALARPLAEKIIGEELFPVTGSEGELSASFDGLTMAWDINSEHKSLNDSLRYTPWDEGNGDHLPLLYRVQMEHQMLVSGAERSLFMASKWDGDTLVEERHCWYVPDLALRAQIIAGWKQFKEDLASYVPPVITVAPVAKTAASLPVVFDMRVEGKLVFCNLEDYKPAALAYIEAINSKLVSDQDFANADADAKFCRDSADKLELSIEQALGQMGDINQALNTVREIAAAFDAKGLALEKLVKAEKENRRNSIVSDAAADLVKHINGLNTRLGKPYMPTIASDFPGAVKGLKSIDSMRDKVATELARCKIEANATADRIQANLTTLRELASEHTFLFADTAQLVLKANDDLTALVKSRIADHKAAEAAKEEATRERIRAEEQAKAEKEAREKLAAEQAAAAPAAPAPAAITPPGPAADNLTHEVVTGLMPASVKQALSPQQAWPMPEREKPKSAPTLTLVEISKRLSGEAETGLNVTSAFLATLGFEATTVKASKLYHAEDFHAICDALIAHIGEVQDQHEAVAV